MLQAESQQAFRGFQTKGFKTRPKLFDDFPLRHDNLHQFLGRQLVEIFQRIVMHTNIASNKLNKIKIIGLKNFGDRHSFEKLIEPRREDSQWWGSP